MTDRPSHPYIHVIVAPRSRVQILLLACSLAIAPAYAADTRKTLHVAFPIAGASFDTAHGTKLAYVLAQPGKLIESGEIEKRLEAVEGCSRLEG